MDSFERMSSSITMPSDSAEPAANSYGRFFAAFLDLLCGALQWRIWLLLATYDIRARYRRSHLGQFWITISMGVMICALALVYSILFKIDLVVYLPLVAISFIVWSLIASLINEGATVFIEAEGYLRTAPLPKSMFIFRMLARNLLIFGHNLVLVPVVMLIFGSTPKWVMLLFFPALLMTLLNAVWLSIIFGTLCARFRDLPPIIASIVQIAFFVSPVMWGRSQLGTHQQSLVNWNPLAAFLSILREPLLGASPELRWWLMTLAMTVLGFIVAIPFYSRFRHRIVFYL